MKKMMVFLFFVFGFVSCQKSALVPQHYQQVSETWIVQEGNDYAAWDAAQFCFPQDYGPIDTTTIKFTDAPNDSTKFGLVKGSIYFPPGDRKATDTPGIFKRHYQKLLEQLP